MTTNDHHMTTDDRQPHRNTVAVIDILASTYGNPYTFEFSNDFNVLLGDIRPESEIVKAIELYDVSNIKTKGVIKTIASLKPEKDTRFSHISGDGKAVCIGLANVDGVTFFSPCVKN